MKRDSLISSNSSVVDCPNTSGCLIKGPGTATITLNFKSEWGIVSPIYTLLRNVADSNRLFKFSMPSVIYYINVQTPNQPSTVTYTGTTDIGYTTAKANWSYSDVDGDLQSNSVIQLATDSGYSNIVFGQSGGSGNSVVLSGLTQGTTYYPRVSVYNAINGWSGWVTGPPFTTQANKPPTINNIQAQGIGYNDAKISWNYSDIDGDVQTWWSTQISTTSSFNINDIVVWSGEPQQGSIAGSGAKTSNDTSVDFFPLNRGKLVANTTYYTRVQVGNGNGGTGWVIGPSFTTKAYPPLIIEYKINKSASKNVTVNTEDNVTAEWNITDVDGGVVDGLVGTCDISSVGFSDIGKTGLPFNSSNSAKAPISPIDQTYEINLSCAAKPGGIAVNEDILLTVVTYPIIICNIEKKIVSTESPIGQVQVRVLNATGPYKWEYKRYSAETTYITASGTADDILIGINYTGLALGQYKPFIKVTDKNNKIAEKECSGSISNFGNRYFQEVAK